MQCKKDAEMSLKEGSCRCFVYKAPVGTFCITFVLHLAVNSFKRWWSTKQMHKGSEKKAPVGVL